MTGSMRATSQRDRYRFAEFTVSPSTRLLLRGDVEIPLIPRYFDLLVLLIERRGEVVTRDEIFDVVWSDVIVSDGALTQAIRILRKALGDRAKDPRFIRTVSRHGYRFVYDDVVKEVIPNDGDVVSTALEILRQATAPANEDEETRLRDAAETVLRSSPDEDLSRFGGVARAMLREVRWDLPHARSAPLVQASAPSGGLFAAVRVLIGLRLRGAFRLIRLRWLGAVGGGVIAGVLGGVLGATVLRFGPGSRATASVFMALPLVGGVVGGLGALGVGGGLAWAEALLRSYRSQALIVLGGVGGGLVGTITHFVGLYTVEGLFGRDLSPAGGGFEGVVLGAAIGAGYALATPMDGGGMATPRARARRRVALVAGITCAVASIALAWTGHHLGAMSLDLMAESFPGSQVSLDPLARLLGETTPGVLTRCAISGFEGALFGFGVVFGLTRRPHGERR
jgi:DNA-binding winged helix-turn-helix (wHTH) protein